MWSKRGTPSAPFGTDRGVDVAVELDVAVTLGGVVAGLGDVAEVDVRVIGRGVDRFVAAVRVALVQEARSAADAARTARKRARWTVPIIRM